MKNYLLTLIGLSIISFVNSEVKKEYTITDFSKSIIDTLSSIEGKTYTTRFINVKGYVNDTIYVSFGEGTYKMLLQKEIETTFRGDYYGGPDAIFVFDPHKATKGKLNVKFSIQ